MHFLTGASVVGLLATATSALHAPKGTGAFNLEVIATDGNLGFSGMWLNPYHTGAGTNALVIGNDQTQAQKFKYNATSGNIYAELGDYQYELTVGSGNIYSPPKHYSYMGFNVEGIEGTAKGFFFNTPGNYLQLPSTDSKDVFSVCPAVIYTNDVYVDTLLYRNRDVIKNATCADVKLKAVF